jgi:hypothetical protein
MSFTAGFILCSTLNFTCEVYVDPSAYQNFHECRAKGTTLYNELTQVATSTDVVLGDCLEIPDGVDKKDFILKALKSRVGDNDK